MRVLPIFILSISSVLLSSCSFVGGVFGVRSMYDEPTFKVVENRDGDIEIRTYEKRIVAEATVPETGEEAENKAFRILFDYITGDNISAEEISMTVPVSTTSEETSYNSQSSETISMTVPVEMVNANKSETRMRFFYPPKYTLENAPKPTDERIEILELPEQTFFVKNMSGWKGRDTLNQARIDILKVVEESDWEAVGEPSTLYYDPPFTLPWLRKQEVILQVKNEKTSDR